MVFSQRRTVSPAKMVFALKQVFGLSNTDSIKLNGWVIKCIALWCDIYHWNKSNSKEKMLLWCDVWSLDFHILGYRQTSDISHPPLRNKIVDHSDAVGASPVGAAPTTSSFSTWHLAPMDWANATARWNKNHLSFDLVPLILEILQYIYIYIYRQI